ncbi:hypothetical protein ACFC26_43120 [Kitasatospora purpeofusca]|uniref:hypothetical protein n=1 Tax=Kitasatospora purpeofusca TaxID=67352 RepID=UPI0035E1E825
MRLEEKEREIAAQAEVAREKIAELPDHPAYQQIMAVFAATDAPLRARAVCEAMDVEIAPSNINNVHLKLKRLADRGILAETEQGAVHPAATVTPVADTGHQLARRPASRS